MACEACNIKFTLFKRKKQCMDCLLYFCTECVIRRFDRILSCDNCSMLSRRPLIRSQILQMRTKYLRQYLVAKKVNIRGCIEKEDLVNLLIFFANGNEIRSNSQNSVNAPQNRVCGNISEPTESQSNNQPNNDDPEDSPTRRSRSPQVNERPEGEVTTPDDTRQTSIRTEHSLEIEEVSESDNNIVEAVDLVNEESEPVITEQEEVSLEETSQVEHTEMFTEIPMWTGSVKLSDIKQLSELEYLTVKQLKDLLSANRVDFKGCVERSELLDRASRLWEEYTKSRKVVETADEEALCKICLDAPIECVILECGHMACCINCGKQMSECPICRQYVVRVVRFFKA